MKRTTLILTLATFVLGALAGAGVAQEEAASRGFGVFKSHLTEDLYDVSVGVTATGRPSTPQRMSENRVHVVVPSHYGDLFQVTQTGDDSVLWFRASDGSVRNAVLDATSAVPYQVERNESTRIEVKLR